MDRIDFKQFVKTHVRISKLDQHGKLTGFIVAHNTFTNAAADILMASLLGADSRQITHLYARYYSDTGTTNPLWGALPSSSTPTLTTRADFIAGPGTHTTGGLWVPRLTDPVRSASSAYFSGNQVTFMFRIPAAPANTAGGAFAAATSYISALGLACADPSAPDTRANDVIFSAIDCGSFVAPDGTPTVPFLVPASGQVAIDYVFSFAPA